MMHKMNKVISVAEWDVAGGREQGGSLYAWAEKSSALRASAAGVRAPAAFRGERDSSGLDWRKKPNKTQSCQIKTS